MNYFKATCGYLLTLCISTPLFVTEHYVLGAISMIAGLAILHKNDC
jgi:hypothetical protein